MKFIFLQFFGITLMLFPIATNAQNAANSSKVSGTELSAPNLEKHKISAAEFLRLPADKQLHIRNNPNLYVLDESIKVELQRPIRHRVLRSEYEAMPETKKTYIDANPGKYVIVD